MLGLTDFRSRAATVLLERDDTRRTPARWFTARPETYRQRLINSAAVWLGLMACWALTDVLLARFPAAPTGRQVGPEGWGALAVFAVLGLVGAACAARTGFPAPWDARIPAARRLLLPLAAGVGFGTLAILIEEVTRSVHTLEAVFGPANVAFPASVLVSAAGAIKYELLFLLFIVPTLLWLVSNVALRGRGQTQAFWVLAALSAAIEPGPVQGIPLLILANGAIGPAAFAAYALHSYAFNFAAAVSFRRYGLLAPVLVRLGNYLVWHVLYGNFFFG
jgi:hypothetical protein